MRFRHGSETILHWRHKPHFADEPSHPSSAQTKTRRDKEQRVSIPSLLWYNPWTVEQTCRFSGSVAPPTQALPERSHCTHGATPVSKGPRFHGRRTQHQRTTDYPRRPGRRPRDFGRGPALGGPAPHGRGEPGRGSVRFLDGRDQRDEDDDFDQRPDHVLLFRLLGEIGKRAFDRQPCLGPGQPAGHFHQSRGGQRLHEVDCRLQLAPAERRLGL